MKAIRFTAETLAETQARIPDCSTHYSPAVGPNDWVVVLRDSASNIITMGAISKQEAASSS